jgi:hypothetical protein
MHQDGAANDGIYGASIPHRKSGALIQYYVSATAAGGAMRFLPSRAGTGPESYRLLPVPFSSPVRINEVLADNDSVDRDQAGDFEDWVELYNTTNQPVDISGYSLTDRFDAPKKHVFPANTVIPANGFLRIWCDEELNEGPDHANFKLAKDGEQVALFASDAMGGLMIDALVYPEQKSNRSYGFVPDGGRIPFFIYEPNGAGPVTGTGVGTAVRYDARRGGSAVDFDLKVTGTPRVNQSFSLAMTGGLANAPAALGLALAPTAIPLGTLGVLAIDPTNLLVVTLRLDATGATSLATTVPASAAGVTVFAQAIERDLSNAVAVRFSL